MICMPVEEVRRRSREAAVHLQDVDPDTGELIELTRQEFRDECDMNKIIERYTPEALIESYNAFKGTFGDFSEVPDYMAMREQVLATDAWFASLPAKIRSRFDNSVTQLSEYLQNPANFDEAVELGLLEKPQVSQGVETPTSPSLDVTGGSGNSSEV